MKKAQVPIVIGIVLVLMVGGVLLLTQCRSRPADAVDGPSMLYFYAEW